jgi:hypothetical protein
MQSSAQQQEQVLGWLLILARKIGIIYTQHRSEVSYDKIISAVAKSRSDSTGISISFSTTSDNSSLITTINRNISQGDTSSL